MLVPVAKKLVYKNDIFVERLLPVEGDVVSKVGEIVEPFVKLGMTKVSYAFMNIPTDLKIAKGRPADGFFYTGEAVGSVNGKKVLAPFDGQLGKTADGFVLRQGARDWWLLAGVWGEVAGVVPKKSVLIKTQSMDFSLAVCTRGSYAGELIVFPNPSKLLEMQYLEKFAKDIFGKIIYAGDFISEAVLKRAIELGAGGLVGGGTNRSTFMAAEDAGFFLGVFGGFGEIPTPKFVYGVLKEISNRYVFVQGEKNLLRVPIPGRVDETVRRNEVLKDLKVGDLVQVFEKPYFGWVGKVSEVKDSAAYVLLDGVENPVEASSPNLISVYSDV